MAAAGGSVGGIYAEAELDITKFQSAAGQLTVSAAGIAGAMALAASGTNSAQLGIDGLASGLAGLGPKLQTVLSPAQFTALGQAAAQAIAGGLAAGNVPAAAQAVGAGAVSAASAGFSGAAGVGRNFVAGLAGGISAGRSGVVNAARAVALAAAQAARAALQIHSPSRVTRGFGENFDRGFVRGVRDGMPAIDRAIGEALYVAPPGQAQARGDAAAPVVSPVQGIDYERLARAVSRQPALRLDLNGREVARINADNTAQAQNERLRGLAQRYGAR